MFVTLAGCVGSSSVMCGGDLICPEGTRCKHVTDPDLDVCADPSDPCVGKPRYTHCGTGGRCYDEVCLPAACGNGRIDRADPAVAGDTGELCDDGNERSGDGCSSDCRSNETCGNGTIDAVVAEQCDDANTISNDGCDSVCRPERATWLTLAADPDQRTSAAITYDISRDRVVMFGGTRASESEPTNETWERSAGGWLLRAPPHAPTPRLGTAMAYDAAHRRVVLFGGGPFGDTWTWDGTTWTEPLVADAPSQRAGHAMAYDTRRERVVLFGGLRFTGFTDPQNDTWEWDGASWQEVPVATPPPARRGHSMVYDPSRGVIVMCCGTGRIARLYDPTVWEYDGVDWRSVTPQGTVPDAINGVLAYDPVLQRVLLVGTSVTFEAAPTWSWDGQRWTPRAALDPPAGSGALVTTDLRRGHVIVTGFAGGSDSRAGTPSVWTWDGATWIWEPSVDAAPEAYRATLDPLRGRIVALSHRGVSELDGASWTDAIAGPGPDPRVDSGLAYDAAHRVTLVFGGTLDTGTLLGDTWSWDGAVWSPHASAIRPPPRANPAMTYDAARSRVVMFGGTGEGDPTQLDDTWLWDGTGWLAATAADRPAARSSAAIAYDPIHQVAILFGGVGSDHAILGDTWRWDGTAWKQVATDGPSPRLGAALAWDAARRRLVLSGGNDNSQHFSDLWDWDGSTWSRQPVVDSEPRSLEGLAGAVGPGIVACGGEIDQDVVTSTTRLLRWEGDSPDEACRSAIDGDGDGLAGCDDPDCWWACTPLCPPGAPCDASAPRCGDGACNAALEDCRICPQDCACAPVCGDAICDPGETMMSCPGDCP